MSYLIKAMLLVRITLTARSILSKMLDLFYSRNLPGLVLSIKSYILYTI